MSGGVALAWATEALEKGVVTVKEPGTELKFGEVQVHAHVAVIPIVGNGDSGTDYLTMKEAMDKHFLTVTEVTEGGTVAPHDKLT